MKRRESWAESRRPTEAEKRKAKRLLSAPGFPPKSAYENLKSKEDRQADAERRETRTRHAAEAVVEDFMRCAEQGGCPYCELDEAHLHGSVLWQQGRPLF